MKSSYSKTSIGCGDDRKIISVKEPIRKKLETKKLFKKSDNSINIKELIYHLKLEGKLYLKDLKKIIKKASKIFLKESNILEIKSPIIVVGDIHGQFYDLLNIFKIGGLSKKYLFLGDYVDRGVFSLEVLILLLSLKINNPFLIYLLRGNHESRQLTEFFTFKTECLYKYNEDIYEDFIELFCCLPLCATIDNQFFCVHGGLSPDFDIVDEIEDIERIQEPPIEGLMCDLLWSDPNPDFLISKSFEKNRNRGCSYYYNYTDVITFLEDNKMLSMIRAHEAQDKGYQMLENRIDTSFPTVITIFSCPNYIDTYENRGSIMIIDGTNINIREIQAVKHPYILPGYVSAFEWSLPFATDKIIDFFEDFFQVSESIDIPNIPIFLKLKFLGKILLFVKYLPKFKLKKNKRNILKHSQSSHLFSTDTISPLISFQKIPRSNSYRDFNLNRSLSVSSLSEISEIADNRLREFWRLKLGN